MIHQFVKKVSDLRWASDKYILHQISTFGQDFQQIYFCQFFWYKDIYVATKDQTSQFPAFNDFKIPQSQWISKWNHEPLQNNAM